MFTIISVFQMSDLHYHCCKGNSLYRVEECTCAMARSESWGDISTLNRGKLAQVRSFLLHYICSPANVSA